MRAEWRVLLAVVALLLGVMAIGTHARLDAHESPGPCELFTRQEAEALLKETITDERVLESNLPAGVTCRYAYRKDGSAYETRVKLATDRSITEEGIHDSAKDVFDRQVKTRRSHEYASERLREFEGIGEGSFWDGSSLWALQGANLVIVTVKSPLKGSFKSMDEMNAAMEDQNLAYSMEIMAKVMERLE